MEENEEIRLYVEGQTDAAWCVSDGPGWPEVWLPKSQVEEEEGTVIGGYFTFIIPYWLAESKDLV